MIDSVTRQVWAKVGDGLLAAACFCASLALYLQTLAPSVATLFDDSLEFPLVAHRLGIAHPTGYPLYTLLAKLASLGPWANVAWGVNLVSALGGALTVALVYAIVRQLGARHLPAMLSAAVLAVSSVFWSQATIAEVYTLHTTFVAALLWLILRWAQQPFVAVRPFSRLLVKAQKPPPLFLPAEGLWYRLPPAIRSFLYRIRGIYRRVLPAVPAKRRLQPHPRIYLLAAIFGLGLAHHRTIVLLIPALLVYALVTEPRILGRAAQWGPERPQRPRWLQFLARPAVLVLLSLCLPLLFYLYLPLRGHVGSLDGTYQNTWRGFWQWVTASSYTSFLADNPLAPDLDAASFGWLFWQQFGPVGLALALVGVTGLTGNRGKALPHPRRGTWRELTLTGLAFVTVVVFALLYRVPDVEVFFIPAFVLVAVWIGMGLDTAQTHLRIRGDNLEMRRLLAVSQVVLVLIALTQPLSLALINFPDRDRSQDWTVHDYGRYTLEQMSPGSTVIGLLGEMTLLRTIQETTGLGSTITTVVADDETERRAAVEHALATGQDVYLTRPLPGLVDDHALDAVTGLIRVDGELETLFRVGPPEQAMPEIPRPVHQELVPGLELLGYGLREHQGHWQSWLRLRLWWRAPSGLVDDYKISARLVTNSGQIVAVTDAQPVSGAYPTSSWRPGEVVRDDYELELPAGLPPGEYIARIIVYEPATGAERGRINLAPVTVQGNPIRPPRRALEATIADTVYARYGVLTLLGYTSPAVEGIYRQGSDLPLVLLWQANAELEGEYHITVWLTGSGLTTPLVDRVPVEAVGMEPWSTGKVVRQWLSLPVPEGTEPGSYQLVMRLTHNDRPLPWGRWQIPLGSDLVLGTVQIAE